MNQQTKKDIAAFCVFMLIVAGLYAADARAGDKITQSNDNNAQTTGNIGGDDSLGIGLSNNLGAAAYGDCLASKQWNAVVFSRQDSEFNPWCAGVYYDSVGLHEQAARMRCKVPQIVEDWPSFESCVAANTIVSPDERFTELVNIIVRRQDTLNEETTAPLRDEVEKLRLELAEATKRRERPVAQPQQTIVQPFLDETKRQALAAIRGDE